MKKQVVKIIDRSYVNRDVKKIVRTGVKTAEKKVDVEKTETDENSEIEKKNETTEKKKKGARK